MQHKIDMPDDWLHRISPAVSRVWSSREERSWFDPRRVIYDHELLLFGSDGQFAIEFDDERYALGRDSFIVIPPGRWHIGRGRATEPIVRAWVHFDWLFRPTPADTPVLTYAPASPRLTRAKPVPPFVPPTILHGAIRDPVAVFDLHERLQQRFNYGTPLERVSARGLALELLLRLLGPADEPAPSAAAGHTMQQLRTDLQRLAQAGFRDAPSVRRHMQERFGRSHDHLARGFKAAYGVTPLTFVNSLRMERAKDLLRDTELSVKEVAARLGFPDPIYFTRLFHGMAGRTPTDFRRDAH